MTPLAPIAARFLLRWTGIMLAGVGVILGSPGYLILRVGQSIHDKGETGANP